MRCCACGDALAMGAAIRIELNGPDQYIVQYACGPCGEKMARALVPVADQHDWARQVVHHKRRRARA